MSNKTMNIEVFAEAENRIAYWLIKNNKKFSKRDIYIAEGRTADKGTIEKVILERGAKYEPDQLIAEYLECAIFDNTNKDFLPNYVVCKDGTRLYKGTYIDMCNRKSAFEVTNGRTPKTVSYETTTNTLENTTKSVVTNLGGICSKLQSYTGVKITDYKSLYRAFNYAVYSYYYNDVYTREQSLNRFKNRQGLNCADLNQLLYYALKELNYNVRIVRGTIKCTSSTYGHIWCQIEINGKWTNIDASAAAKGKSLGSMICGQVTSITNYNPNWLLTDDGRT